MGGWAKLREEDRAKTYELAQSIADHCIAEAKRLKLPPALLMQGFVSALLEVAVATVPDEFYDRALITTMASVGEEAFGMMKDRMKAESAKRSEDETPSAEGGDHE